MNANKIIDALGGTSKVARMFDIKPPSVSAWRTSGIPKASLMYLRLRKPKLFKKLEAEEALESASINSLDEVRP